MNKITRKDFLNVSWIAAGTLVLSESVFVGLRFLSPKPTEGEFGGQFNLGPHDQFPPGSVTPVEAGRFYLVRLEDGGLMAVYRRCTHLGCAVPYEPAAGQFVCPCHGSEFSKDGDALSPPAPRPLDLFHLSIDENADIQVDTSSRIERDKISPDHIVYA